MLRLFFVFLNKLLNMTIQEQIRLDMVNSMKVKNTEKTSLLRVVSGEFAREGKEVSNEQAIKIIRKMVANASDLKNDKEVEILSIYLPKMLNPKEIKVIVKNIIETNNLTEKDMGRTMGLLKNCKESNLIDMKVASQIAKEILTK